MHLEDSTTVRGRNPGMRSVAYMSVDFPRENASVSSSSMRDESIPTDEDRQTQQDSEHGLNQASAS